MDQSDKRKYNFEDGEFFLINKPPEWTSFDAVNYFRKFLKIKFNIKKIKVGHAGTLDPMATGLLIICTGRYTKRIADYQALQKEYEGTMRLGSTTPSYDVETNVDKKYETSHISENLIRQTVSKFTGTISQIPPVFSAVKIKGKKAYEFARKKESVQIKPKIIHIYEFEIVEIRKTPFFEIDFRIVCSKGTYIRSLVNDFGKALNSGAYLTSLCRKKIGNFSLNDALDLPELLNKISAAYGINK